MQKLELEKKSIENTIEVPKCCIVYFVKRRLSTISQKRYTKELKYIVKE